MANPYLPLWEHLPDGEPRVFEDPQNPGKYRAYIIGSHDLRFDSYCGPDIRAWSAPVEDLRNWRDEGAIFTYEIDGQWDVMYAPDLVEVKRKDGTKEYYLYPHSRGPGREAMVCKGPTPIGPFTPINMTEDGRNVLPGSVLGFDPAIYVDYITDPADPDYEIGFRAYGYWGFQRSHAAELDQNTMYSVRPGTEIKKFFIPASSSYGVIRDPEGTTYPSLFPGEDLKAFNFFEAASIRKIGNKYVWVYSGYSGPEYGLSSTNSALRYAYGDTPFGPWKSGGVLVDSRAPVVNKDGTALQTSYSGHNTHGSIEEINGQWYAFYHRAPRSFGYARQPMVAPINVEWDETPVAQGGKVSIRAWNYFTPNNFQTTAAGGYEYKGAEVTSDGFYISGLDLYKYHSAGIACYLSNLNVQADAFDIWNNHAPITGLQNGDIVGYKYFDFAILEWDTLFDVFISAKTQEAFKISVWLDAPWKNAPHYGTKVGEIVSQAGASADVKRYSLDFSEQIGDLSFKHAIYLVAEGGQGELFDLHGLGFSCKAADIECPIPPQIWIEADGVKVELPQIPVRSTNANGIIGYDIYEMTIAKANEVKALASCEKVKTAIDNQNDMVVVKFDYNGKVKTYNIKFE